jgi:Ca2+-transporting ATPase
LLTFLRRPALKKANVGFSMGIAGTEVAKEASDIVLMDDNFASIVMAIVWGRCVNDSVRKFLQFQLSVNIVAVLTTFITAVASEDEESVLTAVQLLWVNLIMDTFAALALATDPATRDSLKRKPDRLSAPLISVNMWKMIIGQSIYQMTVALVLHFAGPMIFNTHNADPRIQVQNERELSTLIFNQFVFCQIFNQLNARVLDRSLNIFRGFYKNYWFLSIFAIMTGGQILIVFVGGAGSLSSGLADYDLTLL